MYSMGDLNSHNFLLLKIFLLRFSINISWDIFVAERKSARTVLEKFLEGRFSCCVERTETLSEEA